MIKPLKLDLNGLKLPLSSIKYPHNDKKHNHCSFHSLSLIHIHISQNELHHLIMQDHIHYIKPLLEDDKLADD